MLSLEPLLIKIILLIISFRIRSFYKIIEVGHVQAATIKMSVLIKLIK